MRLAVMLAALAALPHHALAQDAAARGLAATCAACHGTDGRSASREAASLAGLPRDYIVAQMRAFQEGTRPATVMQQLAKGYTDAQIEAIAGYFAPQRK